MASPGEQVTPTEGAEPPVSRLAVVALVLSIIPCCPLVSMIGVVLGTIALQRIRFGPTRLGGRRVALAALLIGGASVVIWTGAWWQFGSSMEHRIERRMTGLVTSVCNARTTEELEEAAGFFEAAQGTPLTAAGLRQHTEVIAGRYGEIERVRVVSTTTSGGLLSLHYEAALILFFEHGDHTGSARFRLNSSLGDPTRLFLEQLTINDAELGDVKVP